ncbi:MAG TPA: 16S rRNA (adenine(1518)-N(6)/adenine(1519)-N(6))-dimethyltransferase RsmA [Thermoleophilaceae bacterium]
MTATPDRDAAAPRQASLRRLREFGVRPNRELGQNFLIDDNVLGVIGRAAELDTSDVVLEVGGGLGVLSEYLAPRVGHLHVVEIDAALEPALRDALGPHANVTLHLADAVRLDLTALAPEPTKVVANLPYGVAATVILRVLAELPAVERVVAMVQREVAERFAAGPGSKTYGGTSVLAQLSAEVRVERRVPASVFHPAPRVESAIVVMRRTAPPPPRALVDLVHAAFAHRRKALSGSLALAADAEPAIRDRARAALEELGHPADARAERLAPADFAALAARLAPGAADPRGSAAADPPGSAAADPQGSAADPPGFPADLPGSPAGSAADIPRSRSPEAPS